MTLVKRLQRYQRSKLEVEKNICQLDWPRPHGFKPGQLADIFCNLQLWPLISLQSLDKNQYLVPYLKDLFHICLEIKVQGFWMTFSFLMPYFLYLFHPTTVFWSALKETCKFYLIYRDHWCLGQFTHYYLFIRNHVF